MIKIYDGKITEDVYPMGHPGIPAFLLAAEKPAVFDAGVALMGPFYYEELRKILGNGGRLRYVFLTHSHYDHCGSIPYLKKKIPGLETGMSRIAADTLKKPNAIALIRELNKDLPEGLPHDVLTPDMEFEPFPIDFPLDNGDEFDLGNGYMFRVVSTPGHTRDSVSYYIPKLKALITGEAAGTLETSLEIVPEFLSSYSDYLESLNRILTLEIEYLLIGHGFYVTGEDVRPFLVNSISATKKLRTKILNYLDSFHGDQSAAVEKIYQEDYVATGTNRQPSRAFMINLKAKVKVIAAERGT